MIFAANRLRRHAAVQDGLGGNDLGAPEGAHAGGAIRRVHGDGAGGRSEHEWDQVADVRGLPAEGTADRFHGPRYGTAEGEVLAHLAQSIAAVAGVYVVALGAEAADVVAFVEGRGRAFVSGDWCRGGEREEEIDKTEDDHFGGLRVSWYKSC